MEIGLVGGAYTDRSPDLNATTCVNLYPVPGGPGGKTVAALRGTPGKSLFAAIGASAIRGWHVFGGLLYVVIGNTVWEVSEGDPPVDRGTINTTAGHVSMADNGQVMVLVDGQDGWIYSPQGTAVGGSQWAPHAVTLGEYVRPTPNNATGFVYECTDVGTSQYSYPPEPTWPTVEGGTVTQPNDGPEWTARTFQWARITDADFPSATQIAFAGGYFVFDSPAHSGRFMLSKLYANDATDFVEALDFATAEADPDGLVRIFSLRGFIWLLGRSTTEVWYPSGDTFPFTPDQGARGERGCAAVWSAANVGEVLFWLAEDRQGRVQVVMSAGGPAEVISTPALEYAIGQYAAIDDAVGYAYHEEGHTFYVLTFPTADVTWVFDLATRLWHRRGVWNGNDWGRDIGNGYIRYANKNLVGHHADGKVYWLDPDSYLEHDGTAIRRERVAPQVHAEGRRARFDMLQIDMETGVGTVESPAPVLKLDWSDDGGHTWAPATPIEASLGAAGAYGGRVIFRRLGLSRQRYFRVVIEDAVQVNIMAGYLDAEAGAS